MAEDRIKTMKALLKKKVGDMNATSPDPFQRKLPATETIKQGAIDFLNRNVVDPLANRGLDALAAGIATIPMVGLDLVLPETEGEAMPGMAGVGKISRKALGNIKKLQRAIDDGTINMGVIKKNRIRVEDKMFELEKKMEKAKKDGNEKLWEKLDKENDKLFLEDDSWTSIEKVFYNRLGYVTGEVKKDLWQAKTVLDRKDRINKQLIPDLPQPQGKAGLKVVGGKDVNDDLDYLMDELSYHNDALKTDSERINRIAEDVLGKSKAKVRFLKQK
jgi:hypothetical protein